MAISKSQASLGVVIVAGAVALILIQYQAQKKLRAENDSLQQQIAQLRSENQNAPAADSKTMTDEDFNELLRLRGEVTALQSQLNQLQQQKPQSQPLPVTAAQPREPSINTNTGPGRAFFGLQYRSAVVALSGMLRYATDHDNNLPATFDQAANYYASQALATNLSGFVITYQGSLTNIQNPSDAVVLESFQPFIDRVAGGAGYTNEIVTRVYGFADGHVKGHGVGLDGNLEDWELQHVPILKH